MGFKPVDLPAGLFSTGSGAFDVDDGAVTGTHSMMSSFSLDLAGIAAGKLQKA
jgi:hypothetical protein